LRVSPSLSEKDDDVTEPTPKPIVFLSSDKQHLYAAADDGSHERKTLSSRVFSEINDFKVSPDGKLIAYIADQEISGQMDLHVVESDEEASVKVSDLR